MKQNTSGLRRPHRWAALLACTAVTGLVACGGGGEDGSATSPTATAPATPPATGGETGTNAPSAPQALSASFSGEGTFYGATGEGQCSFDASPSNLMVAAMNDHDYAHAAACGEFVAVTGPKGSVTVRITDRCPECKPGDVDLSAQAFARIADPVAGRVPITWHVVAGNVQGPIAFRFKEGSTRYWTAIQVRNHRLPITSLDIRPSGSTGWIAVPRADYNYFVHPTAIPAGPLQVRVTALGGATLVSTLPEPVGGLVVQGTGQFP